ncbi:hypothetical protein BC828DRAFT_239166 [Blastocladiella britannica]|nr:hypothetical protein BC828DRAFT_239166 [Blastocladiella britannica]
MLSLRFSPFTFTKIMSVDANVCPWQPTPPYSPLTAPDGVCSPPPVWPRPVQGFRKTFRNAAAAMFFPLGYNLNGNGDGNGNGNVNGNGLVHGFGSGRNPTLLSFTLSQPLIAYIAWSVAVARLRAVVAPRHPRPLVWWQRLALRSTVLLALLFLCQTLFQTLAVDAEVLAWLSPSNSAATTTGIRSRVSPPDHSGLLFSAYLVFCYASFVDVWAHYLQSTQRYRGEGEQSLLEWGIITYLQPQGPDILLIVLLQSMELLVANSLALIRDNLHRDYRLIPSTITGCLGVLHFVMRMSSPTYPIIIGMGKWPELLCILVTSVVLVIYSLSSLLSFGNLRQRPATPTRAMLPRLSEPYDRAIYKVGAAMLASDSSAPLRFEDAPVYIPVKPYISKIRALVRPPTMTSQMATAPAIIPPEMTTTTAHGGVVRRRRISAVRALVQAQNTTGNKRDDRPFRRIDSGVLGEYAAAEGISEETARLLRAPGLRGWFARFKMRVLKWRSLFRLDAVWSYFCHGLGARLAREVAKWVPRFSAQSVASSSSGNAATSGDQCGVATGASVRADNILTLSLSDDDDDGDDFMPLSGAFGVVTFAESGLDSLEWEDVDSDDSGDNDNDDASYDDDDVDAAPNELTQLAEQPLWLPGYPITDRMVGDDATRMVETMRFQTVDPVLSSDQLTVLMERIAGECVVCYSEPRRIILKPCGCMAMCDGCREQLAESTVLCPCCRRPVEAFSRAYIV